MKEDHLSDVVKMIQVLVKITKEAEKTAVEDAAALQLGVLRTLGCNS